MTGIQDAWKRSEESDEFYEAFINGDLNKAGEELRLAFAVVNVARFLNIQPELALTGTVNKFIDRFEYIESKSRSGQGFNRDDPEEMDLLWEEAKRSYRWYNPKR